MLAATSLANQLCAAALAAILARKMILDTQKNLSHILEALGGRAPGERATLITLAALCVLSAFALFAFIGCARHLLVGFLKDFAARADRFETIFFPVVCALGAALIFFVYSRTSAPWDSIDLIYQTDTNYLSQHYYPVFSFGYDFDWDIGCGGIRHMLATLLTYPIHVVCWPVSKLLFFIPNALPMLYALVNVMLMAATAIALKRLTGSRWIAALYAASFPFTLFTLLLEKYPIAVFLMVMFAYCVLNGESRDLQKLFLISSTGMMFTACGQGFFYGESKKPLERIREYIAVGLSFVLTVIGSGRIYYVVGFFRLRKENYVRFVYDGLARKTIFNRVCGFTNLLASIFYPVKYYVRPQLFYWSGINKSLNPVGVAVFLFAVFVILWMRKNPTVRLFGWWLLLAAGQEIVLCIGVGADPLFSLFFGWGILGLVVMGVNGLVKSPRWRAAVYGITLALMAGTGFMHLRDLIAFMIDRAPA